MTLEAQDFSMRQGEDTTLEYFVTDKETQLPLNLGGAVAIIWELNEGPEDTAHVLRFLLTDPELTVENGAGTNDKVKVAIPADGTRTLRAGTYHHELRTEVGAFDPEQVAMEGQATIKLSTTRSSS